MVDYERAERLSIRAHPDLSEKWVQELIAADPSMIGLGDLELRQKERIQPRAGRLDLLLQDSDTKRRYEVEIQLGPTDETHIVRTIEYWDIERRRYPQYDHCAVLIAEDITSRFLSVISLFNGAVPLIAIQMQALKIAGKTTLVFTRIVDELSRGLVDEDEEAEAAPTSRADWESRATPATMGATDKLLEIARQFDGTLNLKYNKHYIGLQRNGVPFNYITFRPKQNTVTLEVRLPQTDDVDAKITESGLDALTYDARWGQYRLRLPPGDVTAKAVVLRELIRLAYERRTG